MSRERIREKEREGDWSSELLTFFVIVRIMGLDCVWHECGPALLDSMIRCHTPLIWIHFRINALD